MLMMYSLQLVRFLTMVCVCVRCYLQLRLESSRPGLFSKKSYFDQFVAQGPLVSPRFIRSLSVETDGTDTSYVIAMPTAPIDTAAASHLSSTGYQPADTTLASALAALPQGLLSCLEPYVSPEWVTLGAAVGLGCVIGVTFGSGIHLARRFKALY